MGKICVEENHIFQFDFSEANWVCDELHGIYANNGLSILSDTDFIAETNTYIIVVEYKNSNIPNATNPNAFNPNDQKAINKIAYKFYDTWIYLKALNKTKPIIYVYVLDFPNSDSSTRRIIRNKIMRLLPFKFKDFTNVELIKDFCVLSVEEWNEHELFKRFPISQYNLIT